MRVEARECEQNLGDGKFGRRTLAMATDKVGGEGLFGELLYVVQHPTALKRPLKFL